MSFKYKHSCKFVFQIVQHQKTPVAIKARLMSFILQILHRESKFSTSNILVLDFTLIYAVSIIILKYINLVTY